MCVCVCVCVCVTFCDYNVSVFACVCCYVSVDFVIYFGSLFIHLRLMVHYDISNDKKNGRLTWLRTNPHNKNFLSLYTLSYIYIYIYIYIYNILLFYLIHILQSVGQDRRMHFDNLTSIKGLSVCLSYWSIIHNLKSLKPIVLIY